MSSVSVVIAALDERETIAPLIERLLATFDSSPDHQWELILVIEGEDGTQAIAQRFAEADSRVRVLYSARPSGLGNAFRRGFDAVKAAADWVVTLDADLNHQPEEIPRLVEEAIERDIDILIGSRRSAGSRVDGTPVWKRALSGTFNHMVRPFFGIAVRDATSGFRVYKRARLGELSIENSGFAFLPELLVKASERGMRLAESPIHFVFRTSGTSKMDLVATSCSYLGMLARRYDRLALVTCAILLSGLLLRLAMALPVYRFAAEGDALLGAITARQVLDGQWPVFMTPPRLGALGGYLMAGLFVVLGESRLAIHLAPALTNIATMGVWWLFCRELLGPQLARRALPFVAFASPAVLFWTSMPNAYPEVMLLCASTLWLTARIQRRGVTFSRVLGLGFVVGIGLWHSIQTLGCTGPALVWLAFSADRRRMRPAHVVAAALAILVGAAPLIAFNLATEAGSLRGNFASRAAPSVSRIVDNAEYFLSYSLPELIASAELAPGSTPAREGASTLGLLVLGAVTGLTIAGFVTGIRQPTLRSAVFLAALVMVAFATINIFSLAGSMRGLTVRYVMPSILVVPPLIAIGLSGWGRMRAPALVLSAGALLTLDLLVLPLAGTPPRKLWEGHLAEQGKLVETVRASGAEVVVGEYWFVYPLNYLLAGSVIGVPFEARNDALHVAAELTSNTAPARMGVIDRNDDAARRWISKSLLVPVPDGRDDGFVAIEDGQGTVLGLIAKLRGQGETVTPLFADGFESGEIGGWSTPDVSGRRDRHASSPADR